jgi:DNA repair protein RadC
MLRLLTSASGGDTVRQMSASTTDRDLLASIIGDREIECLQGHETEAVLEKSESALVSLGLTRRAAARLSASAELARRFQPSVAPSSPMTRPQMVLPYVAALRSAQQEALVGLLLDTRLCLVHVVRIAVGSLTQVAVTPREVFKYPLEHNATGLILCHNHPSGDVQPSRQDILFTKAMAAAAFTLGIHLFDHLIVARRAYFSFRVAGLLSQPVETAGTAVLGIAYAGAIPGAMERQSGVRPNSGDHGAASARQFRPAHRSAP